MPRGGARLAVVLPQEAINRLGHEPDADLAREFGVSTQHLGRVRRTLGIVTFRENHPPIPPSAYPRLGTVSDQVIADELGVGLMAVNTLRRKLGIPSATQQGLPTLRGYIRRTTIGLDEIEPGERRLWVAHDVGASKRGLVNELGPVEYVAVCKQPCHYCGREPELRVRVSYTVQMHGVDRVDNSIGYIRSNCVPCCFECNRFKGAMSKDEFLAHCARVVRHSGVAC